jgi:tetrahydromethanopterin S-methyltransferase subunit E
MRMANKHLSLSPTTNILLTIVWGTIAAILFFGIEPCVSLTIGLVGAVLGAVSGLMQHLSINQAKNSFNAASSFSDVRNAFKQTLWGRRYIAWLYFSKVVLAIFAFFFIQKSLLGIAFGYLGGYMSLMFVRELITLRDTFLLMKK